MSASSRLTGFEVSKLLRAAVVRVGTASAVVVSAAVTIGGFAAATLSPGTSLGRKAASTLASPDWVGYTGLAALGSGVCTLLAAGIVVSWVVGREFTDGTIVGLLALPDAPAAVARAKTIACGSWTLVLAAVEAVLLTAGGLLLGLPVGGASAFAGTLLVMNLTLGLSILPVMWVAATGRGYLAGIGATLAIVVITNLAAGFGLGLYLPWAIPVLWASGPAAAPAPLLILPILTGLIGAAAAELAWRRLELGRR